MKPRLHRATKSHLASIISALCFLIAAPSFACSVVIENHAAKASIAYDPFDAAAAFVTHSIPIKNIGSKMCDGAIAFFKIGSAAARAGGATALSYELMSQTTSARLLMQGAATSAAPQAYLAAPALRPGEVRMLTFTVRAPPGQIAPPGLYSDMIEAVAYQGSASSLTRTTASTSISVNIVVDAVMSVNLAGGGQSIALDFGTLSAGATRSVMIQARSNQSYRFVVSSEHGGVMKLDPPSADGVAWKVPYTIRINNGGGLALDGDQKIAISRTASALAGSAIPVEIKIGDPSNQRAGRYKDVITVKIDALP